MAFTLLDLVRQSQRSSGHIFRARPLINEAKKRIKKIKKRILAMPADAAAIPAKPNTAATNATRRKMIVQPNMNDLRIPDL